MCGIKKILKKSIGLFMAIIPLKNKIVFESNPDMADNTYALYIKLIEKGYNKKYKCIWLVKDVKKNQRMCKQHNVYFQEIKPQSFIGILKRIWLIYTAKYLVSSHSYIDRKRKNQVVIALGHGTPIKSVQKYFMIGDDCDFTICPSDRLISNFCKELNLDERHMYIGGYPRNDLLFSSKDKLNKLVKRTNEKVIMWMPTFRQHCNRKRTDSEFDFPLVIPIIYSKEELRRFNELLVEKNILLLLKPHPAQDISYIKARSLTNFVVLTDKMISDVEAQLYEILAGVDALITDYSSVYCDYLLLDRPIAITLDDYDEYSKKNGFAYENIKEILLGHQLYNIEQLKKFIDDLSEGRDFYYEDRLKAKEIFNDKISGGYSELLIDKLVKEYNF